MQRRDCQYYVYILASGKNGTLYIGFTGEIERRIFEHKNCFVPGFTAKYGVSKLVYCEIYEDVWDAITREKRLKKWKREWKIKLIESINPGWVDLYYSL